METQTISEVETEKDIQQDVAVIILLYKNPNFKNIFKPYDLEIFGKKMWNWVENACSGYQIKTTTCTPESNILSIIKPMLTNKKYTLVLYSDTPLITHETVEDIITFAISKNINALNLIRGYIFDTEYIKNQNEIKNTYVEKFKEEDFFVVDNLLLFEKANQTMKNRILDFHIQNGVVIKDKNSTFIDADCMIEWGTVIEPFNVLKGKCFIGRNTILESGNVIKDSILGESCIVKNSYVIESKINKNIVIGPFEKVVNKKF